MRCQPLEHGNEFAVAGVSHGHAYVPMEAAVLGPADRTVVKELADLLLGDSSPFLKRLVEQPATRLKSRFRRHCGLPVPGANVLADVAAKNEASDPRPHVQRNRTLFLDGPVGDTSPGIEQPGFQKCAGGTGIN